MQDEATLLKEPEIFRDLSPDQIRKIISIARRVSFPAGAIIMKEGDIDDTMYIMMEGTVEVVKSLILGDFDDEQDTVMPLVI